MILSLYLAMALIYDIVEIARNTTSTLQTIFVHLFQEISNDKRCLSHTQSVSLRIRKRKSYVWARI